MYNRFNRSGLVKVSLFFSHKTEKSLKEISLLSFIDIKTPLKVSRPLRFANHHSLD